MLGGCSERNGEKSAKKTLKRGGWRADTGVGQFRPALTCTLKMKHPTHYQTTLVSFLAPTDTQGARIRLEDGTTGKTRIISYNYAQNNAEQGALAWFAEHGVHPIGRASHGRTPDKCILIHAHEDSSVLFQLFVKP